MVNDGHLKLFITCSYSPNSPKWRNWWFCSPGTWGNLGCERVRRTQCQCFPNCFLQYPLVFSRSYSHIYNINSWFSHQKWWFPIALFFVCLPEGKSSCRQEPGASALWWWWNPTVRVGTLAAWGQGAAAWRRIQSQSQRSLWSLGFFSNEMKWHDMTWHDMNFHDAEKMGRHLKKISSAILPKTYGSAYDQRTMAVVVF